MSLHNQHRVFMRTLGQPIVLLISLKIIHFQSIFLIDFYLKRPIYVQKYGITHQTAMKQGIQEKEEFLQ